MTRASGADDGERARAGLRLGGASRDIEAIQGSIMPSADLREYLIALSDGLLRIRKPVPLDAVSALINQAQQPVLFESIDGYPRWSICDLLFRDRKCQARVLGTSRDNVLSELASRLRQPPRPPVLVDTSPVKENVLLSGVLDLRTIPGFQHGSEDMGRVIIAMTICRDPDTGRQNLAWTRMTPLSERRATYFIGSSPHMRSILAKHEKLRERMPMAFVVGTHPAYEIMASYSVTTHLDSFGELEMVPSLLGSDVELVRCESVPLHVPAWAELVIEGHVLANGERIDEGPGPSQALYYMPGISQQPIFEATAITHRDDPVLRQIDTLMFTDHQPLISLPHEALVFDRIRELGVAVHDVLFIPWGGTMTCVVRMTPEYDGQAMDTLITVLGTRFPNVKLAIAVDDDVDVESAEDLHWCLSTRVEPSRDIHIVPGVRGHPIDPGARAVEGEPRRRVADKWAIDATKPPMSRPAARHSYRKTLPLGWGRHLLSDYL
jgi:2,5-furandicarboxylate decarboxylase 1